MNCEESMVQGFEDHLITSCSCSEDLTESSSNDTSANFWGEPDLVTAFCMVITSLLI